MRRASDLARHYWRLLTPTNRCDNLRHTQVLDLSANAIGVIPLLAVALPALAELILDENALRALGDELVGLSKLKKLSARSNRIAAVDPSSGQQVKQQKTPDIKLQ